MKTTTNHKPQTTLSISPVAKNIESLTITDASSMEQAVSVLSKLNVELDKLTKDREKLTKPMNEALKEIRSRYKPFESQLEGAIAYVRKEMSRYQTILTEQAELQAQEIAKRIGDGITIEEGMNELATIETPDEKVRTEHGSVSFTTKQMFEIEDISKIPPEFLLLDEISVRKEMKKNVKIPGIRYFSVQNPVNRR